MLLECGARVLAWCNSDLDGHFAVVLVGTAMDAEAAIRAATALAGLDPCQAAVTRKPVASSQVLLIISDARFSADGLKTDGPKASDDQAMRVYPGQHPRRTPL